MPGPYAGRSTYPGLVSGSGDDVDVRKGFTTPSDVKMSEGFGATEEDLKRGYIEPEITNHPKYDVANYKDRWTSPAQSDLEGGNEVAMPSDYEFRNKDRETHGLLTRPKVSTER